MDIDYENPDDMRGSDILYLQLNHNAIVKSFALENAIAKGYMINIDFDSNYHIYGIEIIGTLSLLTNDDFVNVRKYLFFKNTKPRIIHKKKDTRNGTIQVESRINEAAECVIEEMLFNGKCRVRIELNSKGYLIRITYSYIVEV